MITICEECGLKFSTGKGEQSCVKCFTYTNGLKERKQLIMNFAKEPPTAKKGGGKK